VVIGSFDRAEIWEAERWAAGENDAFASGELERVRKSLDGLVGQFAEGDEAL